MTATGADSHRRSRDRDRDRDRGLGRDRPRDGGRARERERHRRGDRQAVDSGDRSASSALPGMRSSNSIDPTRVEFVVDQLVYSHEGDVRSGLHRRARCDSRSAEWSRAELSADPHPFVASVHGVSITPTVSFPFTSAATITGAITSKSTITITSTVNTLRISLVCETRYLHWLPRCPYCFGRFGRNEPGSCPRTSPHHPAPSSSGFTA